MAIDTAKLGWVNYTPIEENKEFLKEFGEKTDKAFADALMTGASARELLNTLDPNLSPKTKELIESYAVNAENLADYIAKNGFNPNVNRQIAALARDYASDIAPLKAKYEDFVKRRDAEDARFDQDAQLQKVGRRLNTYSLDEIFFNPDIKDTRELSTSKLHEAAKKMMEALVARTGKTRSWTNQVYKLVEEMGQKGVRTGTQRYSYTKEGIKFTNTNLEGMLDKLRRGEGADDEDKEYFGALYETMQDLKREFKLDDFSPEQQKLFDDAIISGIWDGVKRKDISDSTDNTTFKPFNDRSGNGNKKTTMFDNRYMDLYYSNEKEQTNDYNNVTNFNRQLLPKEQAENNYIVQKLLGDKLVDLFRDNKRLIGIPSEAFNNSFQYGVGPTGNTVVKNPNLGNTLLRKYPITNLDISENGLIATINGKQIEIKAERAEIDKLNIEASKKFKDIYDNIKGKNTGDSFSFNDYKQSTKKVYKEKVPYLDCQHTYGGVTKEMAEQAIGSISKADLNDGKFELEDGIYLFDGRQEDFSLRNTKMSGLIDIEKLNYHDMKICVFTGDAALGLWFGNSKCIVIPADNINDDGRKAAVYQIQAFNKALQKGPNENGRYIILDENLNQIEVDPDALEELKPVMEQKMLLLAEAEFGLRNTTHKGFTNTEFTDNLNKTNTEE